MEKIMPKIITYHFSEEEIKKLDYERYNHPHPRVQRKKEIVYLKSQNLSVSEIIRICKLNKNTVRSYLNNYFFGGIEKLKEINFYRPNSELLNHKQTSEEYFRNHPPMTITEVSAKIEELTGVKRGLTQVKIFLKPFIFVFNFIDFMRNKLAVNRRTVQLTHEKTPQM